MWQQLHELHTLSGSIVTHWLHTDLFLHTLDKWGPWWKIWFGGDGGITSPCHLFSSCKATQTHFSWRFYLSSSVSVEQQWTIKTKKKTDLAHRLQPSTKQLSLSLFVWSHIAETILCNSLVQIDSTISEIQVWFLAGSLSMFSNGERFGGHLLGLTSALVIIILAVMSLQH